MVWGRRGAPGGRGAGAWGKEGSGPRGTQTPPAYQRAHLIRCQTARCLKKGVASLVKPMLIGTRSLMSKSGIQPPQRRAQPVRRRNRRAQPPRRSRSHLVASPHARTSNGSGIPLGAARQRGAAATRAYELLPSSWQLSYLDRSLLDSRCPCKRLYGHLPTVTAHNVTLYGAPHRPYGGEDGSQRPSCCWI